MSAVIYQLDRINQLTSHDIAEPDTAIHPEAAMLGASAPLAAPTG
jgi:DNA-binding PucR family transcriptional regulator